MKNTGVALSPFSYDNTPESFLDSVYHDDKVTTIEQQASSAPQVSQRASSGLYWTPFECLKQGDFLPRYKAAKTLEEKREIYGEAQLQFWDTLSYYYRNPRGEEAHRMLKEAEKLFYLRRHCTDKERWLDKEKGELKPLWKIHECEIAVHTIDLDIYEDDIRPYEGETLDNPASYVQYAIPEGKVFYAEPYIACPSYIYNDFGYLHILHYWYWLWFIFISLICFFFITFLCVVRWNNNRVKPRRETRGVSRSKCADLITAFVPTGWAISIIVTETTDATDLNDGFGTGEIIVGVRAYQWGWEYFYPKSIDLGYNVRPGYSSFVGNSIKYNSSSSNMLESNYLWRMYQRSPEESSVLPAHTLVAPLDSTNNLNLLNFGSIGSNTLKESVAFSKIRNSAKLFTSHLVHSPSSLTAKYNKILASYVDENAILESNSYRLKRQSNLLSTSALGNAPGTTILDSASFNKFLTTNLHLNQQVNLTPETLGTSPLSLDKPLAQNTEYDDLRIAQIVESLSHGDIVTDLSTSFQVAPHSTEKFNDNSDKAQLGYPTFKLLSRSLLEDTKSNLADTQKVVPTYDVSEPAVSSRLESSKVFNISGPNSKVLANDQSIRHFPELSASSSNLNLSSSRNAVSSNLKSSTWSYRATNPNSSLALISSKFVDSSQTTRLGSTHSYTDQSHPAVISNRAGVNSLDFDSTNSHMTWETVNLSESRAVVEKHSEVKFGKVNEAYVGSREKSPRFINSAYWSTFWANSNPQPRVESALRAGIEKSLFYLPTFTNYSDYDFRNDQAIDLLEDAYWETVHSSYSFFDYMNLAQNFEKTQDMTPYESGSEFQFHTNNNALDLTSNVLLSGGVKDLSLIGNFYANNVQLEDYPFDTSRTATGSFYFVPMFADLADTDDMYAASKASLGLGDKFSTPSLESSSFGVAPRSYASVFNNFRSDFEDFNWSYLSAASDSVNSELELLNDGVNFGNDALLSNPAVLRSSIRNSIVTFNAFQKVFRPRFDEGRANTHSLHYSDLALKQPFLSDVNVPYTSLLGKNRDSFYSTPLYNVEAKKNFNAQSDLLEALNVPMYDFPFLLGRTSDMVRFIWIDWFAKWEHLEVQPASSSRYSTLGVPYLRRPFDYNSDGGDKFQDIELYLTRIARSRRNYITNWSYSPFMHNRVKLWQSASNTNTILTSPNSDLSTIKELYNSSALYWASKTYTVENSNSLNFSVSGNDIYQKSTWRPRGSIQGYYYSNARLVDILSKREYLYRRFMESAKKSSSLPRSLTASPNNPLLAEIKSSFRFVDPSTYHSEYSRDLLYTSDSYFKYTFFKALIEATNNGIVGLPVNTSLLNDYVFYYFFGSESQRVGENLELYKNQFRPLKKWISNMLRLHATGAVAMPVEIRIQILASSRDVIHSWAIPAASIKIDCVPGYTSHRIMKFILTGIYWGQCQEICGRYHHWMPIVVYFMKRDLFFLWCTHFIFAPKPHEEWQIADRRFADFVKFVAYDRSSWLTDLDHKL